MIPPKARRKSDSFNQRELWLTSSALVPICNSILLFHFQPLLGGSSFSRKTYTLHHASRCTHTLAITTRPQFAQSLNASTESSHIPFPDLQSCLPTLQSHPNLFGILGLQHRPLAAIRYRFQGVLIYLCDMASCSVASTVPDR